jgi:SpoVK/Ycf46/Vps4 family AAA+-type ATPase
MAASDQIKSLIKSFGDGDDIRFFASAMQIAAAEARQGHGNFANELKTLIEDARKKRSSVEIEQGRIVNMPASRREVHELIEVFKPRTGLSDMVLAGTTKKRIVKVIEEQKKWQLLKHHNLDPIRKLLVTGPPGTGKTMTAHVIAGELGIPLFVIRLDGLLSKYMGESIVKLRVIFDLMPSQRAVYLFDEFDSIGSSRQHGQDVGEIKRILNSFLINIEKDTSNSIIIAATNIPDALDPALFRRFDEIIKYPMPKIQDIIDTIKKNTKGYSFDKRVNYKAIASDLEGINFSDIAKASQATIKEMILTESSKLHVDFLQEALKNRNR